MQYICFIILFCNAFVSDFPHSLLYQTNPPNTLNAMSRLLNFKLPLHTYCILQNISPMCRIHSMLITSSSCSFLGLGCPFGSTLEDLTANSLCLSVCPCHKTLEIHKRLDINTFSIICSQHLPFSDTKGPCRQKDVTANLGKLFYI